jgi:transcriptional regulator with XRE-family HTH domain
MLVSTDREFLQQMGQRIVTLRKERGLSQQDLAYRIGMEKSNLSVIENGKSNPQVLTLVRIASALGLQTRDIFVFDVDSGTFMEAPPTYTPRKHKG